TVTGRRGGLDRRQFMGAAAAAALLLPFVRGRDAFAAVSGHRLLPGALKAGDTVTLVSPSSPVDDSFDLQLAREVMEALGFKVKTGAHYADQRGHLAGSDAGRADDINTAFADVQTKAVICVRGGSGAARLLPLLDYDVI